MNSGEWKKEGLPRTGIESKQFCSWASGEGTSIVGEVRKPRKLMGTCLQNSGLILEKEGLLLDKLKAKFGGTRFPTHETKASISTEQEAQKLPCEGHGLGVEPTDLDIHSWLFRLPTL